MRHNCRFFCSDQLQVKICGLRTLEDAQAALDVGADALGFNFYPASKRFVPLETAVEIISKLPQDTTCIAVVVNPTRTEVQSLRESGIFAAIQFHGDELPEFCLASGFPVWIKAIQLRSFQQAEEAICSFSTPYILLESDVGKSYGGTGTVVDFSLAARIVQAFPQKYFLLAGGLHPGNAAEAASTVRPFALDVASGVETKPGRKARSKMHAFVSAVRDC